MQGIEKLKTIQTLMNSYRQDYHVHTRFSLDSDARMAAACQAAIAAGIHEIAFTDHLDFGPDDSHGYFRSREYLAAIEQCRLRCGDQLVVRAGVEVGESHLFGKQASEVIDEEAFDVILGSAHYADGMRAAWREDFFQQPLREAYESYFKQVVGLAAGGDYDVLAHVDLVKRDARKFGKEYDGPEPYGDMIRTALRSIVERGRGIELNTSPLRRGQPEPCPSLQILRWYHELGGEVLTIGSDAHSPAAVGADLDVAIDMAQSVGFDYVACFHNRTLCWMPI